MLPHNDEHLKYTKSFELSCEYKQNNLESNFLCSIDIYYDIKYKASF